MVEIHAAYNKERFEKLGRMFGDDPRQGNATLYVREHFNRKRVCESCGKRTTTQQFAVASVIAEGPSWVLPISVRHDGQILVDLEESIPDQSNFFSEEIIDALGQLGMTYNSHGSIEYVVPVTSDRDAHFASISPDVCSLYERAREFFSCRVVTNASADDVLKWDTEIEYDYLTAAGADRACGYNVQTQYFQWLADHGKLVVARVSDQHDVTIAIGYAVPSDYEFSFVAAKHRMTAPFSAYSFYNVLLLMVLDHIYEQGSMSPLSLGTSIGPEDEAIFHPIPVVKPRLEFSNRVARQTLIDCFGST